MVNSFGSSVWMLPFSPHCKADHKYWKHFSERSGEAPHAYDCDEEEFKGNYSGWPTNLINIEIPSVRGEIKFCYLCYFVRDPAFCTCKYFGPWLLHL